MASLGIGSFPLSKKDKENKSYIHVKLTDSAYKAIEDYIKSQDTSNGSPSIYFNGIDGEFSIPNHGIDSTKFNFTLQDLTDDQQGSYESIKQSGAKADLEALGPMMAKMKIAAKQTDSFQMTRDRMAQDQVNINKKRAKEMEPKMSATRRSSPPTVTSCPVKDQLPSSSNSSLYQKNTLSRPSQNSTANNGNADNQPVLPPPPPRSPIKHNPDLLKLPLRERLIQLLAVRSYKKLEIHSRITKEGCIEKDKRNIIASLMSVTSYANNNYQLLTEFWEEVKEDWSFYTDSEKSLVRQNKAQHVSPNISGNKGQSPFPTMPSSPTSISTDTLDYKVTGQITCDRMVQDQVNNNIKCVKEVETKMSTSSNVFGRQRSCPVTVTGFKRSSPPTATSAPTKDQSSFPAMPSSPSSISADTVDYRVTGRITRVANQPTRDPTQLSRAPSQSSRVPSQLQKESSQSLRESNISSVKRISEVTNDLDITVKKIPEPKPSHNRSSDSDTGIVTFNKAQNVPANTISSSISKNMSPRESSQNSSESKQTSKDSISLAKQSYENTNGITITGKKRGHDRPPVKESKPDSYSSRDKHPNSQPNSHQEKTDYLNTRLHTNHHVNGYNNNYKPYKGQHMDGEEPDYLREYTKITTLKQRTQYRANFKRDYKTYFELYKFIVSYTHKFVEFGHNLQNAERDSEKYNRIKQEIIREYNVCQEDKRFQNSKKEYSYMHEKLIHVKQLVEEYDNSPLY